jgi:Altered inheritance of mitochondria protein 21
MSPRPASAAKQLSAQHTESPLRKMKSAEPTDDAEGTDEEIIHVDQPNFALPVEGNTPGSTLGSQDEEEHPILAADELALHPETRYMTPAIELDRERRNSQVYDITPLQSRPHSRSNSVQHQVPPQIPRDAKDRDMTGTPLEDVQEYEPLFPEDEDKQAIKKRRTSSKDDHRGARHQFRSKDVWEDAPDSHLHETVVATPQLPEFSVPEAEHEPKEIFENAEDEEARKARLPSPEDTAVKSLKPQHMYNKDIQSEMSRPAVRHRFPSQDIWEDTPDSLLHTAEVDAEPKESPVVPGRPTRPQAGTSPPETKKAPIIPDRPKPTIPARPSKESSVSSHEEAPPLTRSISKEKPPVPSRPAGSKIAALKGAFMTTLESRLQAGPQGPPKQAEKEVEEKPEQEAPLADARKGRARGPARRKPAASPSAIVEESRPKVSFVSAVTIWQIDEDGVLSVGSKGGVSVPLQTKTAEKDVQTGQTDIEIPKASSETEPEKATVYLGGRAPEKGTVVVKDGEELLGNEDGLGSIEKTTLVTPY